MMNGPRGIALQVAPEAAGAVCLGLAQAEPVTVAPARPDLERALEQSAAALRERWGGRSPAEIPALNDARRLYRAFGIDPTRTRPSSEALLRRVLKGQPIPRILNAVDVCNLCSLEFLLPIGLYDRDALRGPVVLRRGAPGEGYPGIRKEIVHLEGRPTLADDEGAFGNPSSDSARTSVRPETRSIWMVIFAPDGFDDARLLGHVAFARDAMARHLSGGAGPVRTAGAVRTG